MRTAFVVMGRKIWPAQVMAKDDTIVQVLTDAAPLVGNNWKTLCFHAKGQRQGEALVGTARLTFSEARAQVLVQQPTTARDGWDDSQEDEMFNRLLDACGGRAEIRRKHYRQPPARKDIEG